LEPLNICPCILTFERTSYNSTSIYHWNILKPRIKETTVLFLPSLRRLWTSLCDSWKLPRPGNVHVEIRGMYILIILDHNISIDIYIYILWIYYGYDWQCMDDIIDLWTYDKSATTHWTFLLFQNIIENAYVLLVALKIVQYVLF